MHIGRVGRTYRRICERATRGMSERMFSDRAPRVRVPVLLNISVLGLAGRTGESRDLEVDPTPEHSQPFAALPN